MVPNSKYEDRAYMLTELCKMFTDDDLLLLMDVGVDCPAKMSAEEFYRQYMKILKSIYISNMPALSHGKYQKVSFVDLHKNIVAKIIGSVGGVVVKTENDEQATQRNRNKIQELKKNIQNKINKS